MSAAPVLAAPSAHRHSHAHAIRRSTSHQTSDMHMRTRLSTLVQTLPGTLPGARRTYAGARRRCDGSIAAPGCRTADSAARRLAPRLGEEGGVAARCSSLIRPPAPRGRMRMRRLSVPSLSVPCTCAMLSLRPCLLPLMPPACISISRHLDLSTSRSLGISISSAMPSSSNHHRIAS